MAGCRTIPLLVTSGYLEDVYALHYAFKVKDFTKAYNFVDIFRRKDHIGCDYSLELATGSSFKARVGFDLVAEQSRNIVLTLKSTIERSYKICGKA